MVKPAAADPVIVWPDEGDFPNRLATPLPPAIVMGEPVAVIDRIPLDCVTVATDTVFAALEPEIELPGVVGALPNRVVSAFPPVITRLGVNPLPELEFVFEVIVRMPLPCPTVTGVT